MTKDALRSTEHRPYYAHDHPQALEPGRIYHFEVEIWPTSWVFKKGQAGRHTPGHQFGQTGGQTFEKSKMAPYLFAKLPDSVIGPYDPLVLPGGYEQVDWELELGLVIGQEGRSLSVERALEHVAGFVVINDITARDRTRRQDWPMLGSDWFISKSVDAFCPMGPYLVPREFAGDYHDLKRGKPQEQQNRGSGPGNSLRATRP